MKEFVKYFVRVKSSKETHGTLLFGLKGQEFGLKRRLGTNGFQEFLECKSATFETENEVIQAILIDEEKAREMGEQLERAVA